MDLKKFWKLIGRADRGDGVKLQTARLEEALIRLPLAEVEEFDWIFSHHVNLLTEDEYLMARELLTGSADRLELDHHVYWLISRGREVFAALLADPAHLAEVPVTGDIQEGSDFRDAPKWAMKKLGSEKLDVNIGDWEIDTSHYPEFALWAERNGAQAMWIDSLQVDGGSVVVPGEAQS